MTASHSEVLITGSSGFLGQAIAAGLMDRYRVIGLDLKAPSRPVDGMDTVEIDLTSDESVRDAMAQVRARGRRTHRLGHPSRRLLRHLRQG